MQWMARGRAFVYYAWGSEFHPQSCVLVQACTYTHTPSPAPPTHPHTHTQTGEKEREEKESKGDGCSKGKKRKREKRGRTWKRRRMKRNCFSLPSLVAAKPNFLFSISPNKEGISVDTVNTTLLRDKRCFFNVRSCQGQECCVLWSGPDQLHMGICNPDAPSDGDTEVGSPARVLVFPRKQTEKDL